jgi:Ca2+/H+ antiporter
MGDSGVMFMWSVLPMLISIGIAVFFIILAIRLVRAVERIADKLG